MSKSTNAGKEIKLLPGINDRYGGIVVEIIEPMDSDAFSRVLQNSIANWKQQGKKGVWIKLPIRLINLAEVAVKEGFWFHHAESSYLMLVNWLPKGPHALPPNASHRVGVAAFVMNDKNEVLVVQEKIGRFSDRGIWKFPTGGVNEGEDIIAAVVREVKEETGIDTEFLEVLSFRQNHKCFYGKSGLFFLCVVKPLSFEIQVQESEIEAAQWMAWEEYREQPFIQNYELLKCIMEVSAAKKDGKYSGFTPVSVTSPDSNCYLYLNQQDLKRHSAHPSP